MSSAERASPWAFTIIDYKEDGSASPEDINQLPGANLLLLNGLVNQECCAESSLLSNLLGFDCMCEFGRESDVGDGNIVKNEVEAESTLGQVLSNKSRHLRRT